MTGTAGARLSRIGLAALFVLCSCVRGGFSPDNTDGAGGDTSTADLRRTEPSPSDLSATCLPWVEPVSFEVPTPVVEVNTASYEQEPFLTADGLTLFFCSDRPGGQGGSDIYFVTRPTVDAPFGPVQSYATLNTPANEWRLIVTVDGLTAYLTSDRPGGEGSSDIWVGTRNDPSFPFVSAGFTPSGILAEVNSPADEHDPWVSADNLRLYFYRHNWYSTNPPSDADLVFAERASTSEPFGPPAAIPGVNDFPSSEGNAVLSPDERLILFNSLRPGGIGDGDIWYATRPDRSVAFSAPRLLPALNSAEWEANLHLTADGCELWFTREDDILRARLQP